MLGLKYFSPVLSKPSAPACAALSKGEAGWLSMVTWRFAEAGYWRRMLLPSVDDPIVPTTGKQAYAFPGGYSRFRNQQGHAGDYGRLRPPILDAITRPITAVRWHRLAMDLAEYSFRFRQAITPPAFKVHKSLPGKKGTKHAAMGEGSWWRKTISTCL